MTQLRLAMADPQREASKSLQPSASHLMQVSGKAKRPSCGAPVTSYSRNSRWLGTRLGFKPQGEEDLFFAIASIARAMMVLASSLKCDSSLCCRPRDTTPKLHATSIPVEI